LNVELSGMACAESGGMGGVTHFKDLIAWQTATLFNNEIRRLVNESPGALRDYKYRDQIFESSLSVPANIAEGFVRFKPKVFKEFLGYSLGSILETEERLRDGIKRGYFKAEDCADAFRFGRRCFTACVRLRKSQDLFV
jgi:four helix bundle protein